MENFKEQKMSEDEMDKILKMSEDDALRYLGCDPDETLPETIEDIKMKVGPFGRQVISYLEENVPDLIPGWQMTGYLYEVAKDRGNRAALKMHELANQYWEQNKPNDLSDIMRVIQIRTQGYDIAREIVQNEILFAPLL